VHIESQAQCARSGVAFIGSLSENVHMTETIHFLREWREHRGLSQWDVEGLLEELVNSPEYADNPRAQKAGRSYSVLGKMERGKSPASDIQIELLAKVYKTAPRNLLRLPPADDTGAQNSDSNSSPYGSNNSTPSQPEGSKSGLQILQTTHTVTIKGRVTAGIWRAMKEYDQDLGQVLFNAPKLKGKKLYGLIVEGNSVNLKYPDGTTVIIASIFDRRPKNRDFVVLRNYVAVDIAEMTLKQAIKGDDGVIRYYCCSNDPEYKDASPIVIPPSNEYAQLGYEVIGSVVGSMPRFEESDEEELTIEPAVAAT
jgi:transcriptional regulator with XRE-family HTH domain